MSRRPVNRSPSVIFPAGAFYWGPFQSRSIKPLIAVIGNDLDRLRRNMEIFDWQALNIGDFGARISAFGHVHVDLIYRCGDDELPPAADVLFDAALKRVFCAEDIAVLAGRVCLSLLRH